MNKSTILTIILTLGMILAVIPGIHCTSENEVEETEYVIFDVPGLFSISCPSDWEVVESVSDEIIETIRSEMGNESEETSVAQVQGLLFTGIPYEEAYVPGMKVAIDPRSMPDYWTLQDIIDINIEYTRIAKNEFQLLSRGNRTVNKMEAVIIDISEEDKNLGALRYRQLFTVKDKFVWTVICGCLEEDFADNEEAFDYIINSLRIYD